MPVASRWARTIRALVWTIRALAIFEAADALGYLAGAGWFTANRILTALVAGAIVGAALTWVRRPLAVVGLGGLLVGIAPSVFYPLSALLVVSSFGVILMARVGVGSDAAKRADANLP